MERTRLLALPERGYWRNILKCKGCGLPLERPVFYCYNTKLLHALCKMCTRCSVPGCSSRVGTTRSIILEKILSSTQFLCEYKCGIGSVESSLYRSHLSECHCRPLICRFCDSSQGFTSYLTHLKTAHGARESELDKETLIMDFEKGQPRMQYVRFCEEIFIIFYYKDVLWVELFSLARGLEEDFKIRVSGIKYPIESEIRVVGVRNSFKPSASESVSHREKMKRKKYLPYSSQLVPGSEGANGVDSEKLDENSSDSNGCYIIPPRDEELFLLFVNYNDDGREACSDNAQYSSYSNSSGSSTWETGTMILREYSYEDDGVFV